MSLRLLAGAGADDLGRGAGAVGEDRGRVGLELAVGAFRGEDALFVDGQAELFTEPLPPAIFGIVVMDLEAVAAVAGFS